MAAIRSTACCSTFGLAFILEDGTRYIWGAQSLPFQVPGWLMAPLSNEYFFLTGYRLFMVLLVAIAVIGLFLILSYTRLGIRIRAGTLDLETVSVLGVNVRIAAQSQFRARHLSRRSRRRARRRAAGTAADDRAPR